MVLPRRRLLAPATSSNPYIPCGVSRNNSIISCFFQDNGELRVFMQCWLSKALALDHYSSLCVGSDIPATKSFVLRLIGFRCTAAEYPTIAVAPHSIVNSLARRYPCVRTFSRHTSVVLRRVPARFCGIPP